MSDELKSRSQMRRVAAQSPDTLIAEIERLRAELGKARRDHSDMEAWGKEQLAHAERLRAEVEAAKRQLVEQMSGCCDCPMFKSSAADNARLREALPRIAAHAGHPDAAEGCRLILGVVRDLEGK